MAAEIYAPLRRPRFGIPPIGARGLLLERRRRGGSVESGEAVRWPVGEYGGESCHAVRWDWRARGGQEAERSCRLQRQARPGVRRRG